MAMSNHETSCTSTFPSACVPLATRGVHALLEVWLTPELWGVKNHLVFRPHIAFHFQG